MHHVVKQEQGKNQSDTHGKWILEYFGAVFITFKAQLCSTPEPPGGKICGEQTHIQRLDEATRRPANPISGFLGPATVYYGAEQVEA